MLLSSFTRQASNAWILSCTIVRLATDWLVMCGAFKMTCRSVTQQTIASEEEYTQQGAVWPPFVGQRRRPRVQARQVRHIRRILMMALYTLCLGWFSSGDGPSGLQRGRFHAMPHSAAQATHSRHKNHTVFNSVADKSFAFDHRFRLQQLRRVKPLCWTLHWPSAARSHLIIK